jgi:hypothetical protein
VNVKQLKIKIMKAIVKVNENSIGMFYNITENETRTEMHKRIMDFITSHFGVCQSITINWEY